MRTYQHVIDTMAVKKTLASIPDSWVVRDLSERDYGIDLMIEIFSDAGLDSKGHAMYDTTGYVCFLQIKGTNETLVVNQDDETVSFTIEKKALLYAEKFSTPFIIVRVCTLTQSTSIYYLWLQRYIVEVLDLTEVNWRTETKKSYSVRIPITNNLPDNSQKIEKIASRIKYIEEHSEFYERYSLMEPSINEIGHCSFQEEEYDRFVSELKRIQTFKTLLIYNTCQVDENCIADLIDYIIAVKGGEGKPEKETGFKDNLYFLHLLLNDNFLRMYSETMIAENDNDTVY